jgi:hypothetical protein
MLRLQPDASNLRQDVLAVNQYRDNHGYLPPYIQAGIFSLPSHPYIFQYLPSLYQTANAATWVCPSDSHSLASGNARRELSGLGRRMRHLNYCFDET